MANGPLGGNMGTPPVPPQPPQVSFETTAQSRGNFNNFLKSMPNTTAMTPLPPMGSPSMMPAPNPMGNIDIFNEPTGMQFGGVPPRNVDIMGQPHMLSYITPQEGNILKDLGGAGKPGPMGIPSFYEFGGEEEGTTDAEVSEAQEASGGYGGDNNEESIVGDDPDFSYNPDTDSFDVATQPSVTEEEQQSNQGLAQGFMQGKGLTNITNVGPNSNLSYSPQFAADVAQSQGLDPSVTMSPEDYSLTTQGQAAAQAQMDDAMAIDQAMNQAPAAANIASAYSPQAYGLGNIVDDPFGLGVVTGFGPMTDAQVTGMYGATANPQSGTQMAGPGFGGFNVPSVSIAPTMPVGRPDNLTSISKGIDVTNPAEMRGLEDAVRDNVQVGLTNDDVDINTPAGQQMEDIETASLMNDVLSGQVDAPDGIGQPVDVTTGLDVASLAPSATVNPADFTGLMSSRDVAPAATTTSNVNPADFTGLMSSRDVAPASTTAPTTDSVVEAAIKDAVPSRSISDILGAMNQKTDLQSQVAQSLAKSGVISGGRTSFSPDVFDPTSLQISDMAQTIGSEVPSGFSPVGSGISPSFTADQVAQSEVDQAPSSNALGFASSQGIPGYDFSMTDINPNTAVEAGTKGIGASVNTSPAPPGFEEQVGKPYSGTPIGQIESFYNAPTTMTQLGVPPGMINSALSVFENLAKDAVASDLISGLYDPIVDRDGNITGSRNPRTGAVQSGMDFNATDTSSNENDNPFILKKKDEKDDEKEDKPPNVIGGVDPKAPVSSGSAVVDSPFTSNVGDFIPASFNTGELNKLIEALTGVAVPKSMKQGGVAGYAEGGRVMQALDNLLATG